MVIPMQEQQSSPLARLVLFMVCLSVAATFIAVVHYAAVDLPQQKVVAPKNFVYPAVTDCDLFLDQGCDNYCSVAAENEPFFDWGACYNHCDCLTAACQENDPAVMTQKKAAC